ncbi:MAG: HTH domain-containing protein [Phycisphaerae bacterium]|nr:HTH domain-containing protein [Phycisphaerae bacterium]
MFYQRSYEIERRLEAVLRLIRRGRFSTPMIAEQLGVSIPTVSRDVTALRQRGHDIRSERDENGWRYVLEANRNHGRKRRSHSAARITTSTENG